MVSKLGGVSYVSLQSGREGGSALEQHLAQGVLVAPGVVLLPDATGLDSDKALVGAHALLVVPGRRGAQRVAAESVQVLGLEGGRPVAGALRLVTPVDPGTKPRGTTSEVLTKALESEGSLWSVLRGLVPEGSGPGADASRFLDGIGGGLPDGLDPREPERVELPDLMQIGWSICRLVPWCEPVGPWGGRG